MRAAVLYAVYFGHDSNIGFNSPRPTALAGRTGEHLESAPVYRAALRRTYFARKSGAIGELQSDALEREVQAGNRHKVC